MQEARRLSRAAGAFFSGTFLSRLTGFGRDLTMAAVFGATPAVAAFMVAFRFANLARRLFGESPLASSFIPHFEALRSQSDARAKQFFGDCFLSMLLMLVAIVGPAMWLMPAGEVGEYTRLMLPGLIFICLFGLSNAYLQCEKRFFLSSAAPIAFNVVWIVAVLLLKGRSDAMKWLSISVVLAFALQWLVSFMPMKGGFKLLMRARPFSFEVRQLVTPFFLGILGVGASQINSAFDALFARFAALDGPAYLWYAIRLQQLPLVLFGMAWSTALLPQLSRATEGQSELIKTAVLKSAIFLIPVTFLLFPCGSAGVNLLFGHGAFSQEAVRQTTFCLWAYGGGLFFAALVMILAAALYAQKDYRTPSIAAALSVLVNLSCNALFVFVCGLGPISVAIATTFSQIFNAAYLFKKVSVFDRALVQRLLRWAGYSLIAALVATLLYPDPILCGEPFSRSLFEQLLAGLKPLAVFAAVFAVFYKLKS